MKHADVRQRTYWALRDFHDRKKRKLPDAVGFELPAPRDTDEDTDDRRR